MTKTTEKIIPDDINRLVDEFNAFAEGWLKQGVREMDRVYSAWERKYDILAEEAFALYSMTGPDGHPEEHRKHASESAMAELVGHISAFRGFSISDFLGKAHVPDGIIPAPGSTPDNEDFVQPIGREFWEPAEGDTRKTKIFKRWHLFRLRSTIAFGKKKNKPDNRWGTRRFHPRLLVSAYYTNPLMKKVLNLLEKRQREHAIRFNSLHLSNEKELKVLISNAIRLIYQGDDMPEMNSLSKDDKTVKKVLSPVRVFLDEMKAYAEERLDILKVNTELAGTLLLKKDDFGYEAVSKAYQQTLKEQSRHAEGWHSYFKGEGSDWVKDLEILSLQMQTVLITKAARQQIHDKIGKDILPLIGELLSLVRGSFEEIKAAENSPEFRGKILQESRQGLRNLRLKTIPNLIDAFNKAQFIKTIENFARQVNHRFNALDDGYAILQRLDFESIPPLVGTRQINLKKIIAMEHLSVLKDQSDEFSTAEEQSVIEIIRGFNEIGHMLQVNLEAALELLDREGTREWKKEDTGKVVSDGLDRIYTRIEKLNTECRNIPGKWSKDLSGSAFNFIIGINELLDNENITDLVIRQTKAEASKRFSAFSHRTSLHIRHLFLTVWKVVSFGLSGAQSSYKQLSKITGMSGSQENERELMSFLYTTDNKIQELPYIYQRLFRLQALNDSSIFTGRAQELERLEDDFHLWKAGNFASVAIIGKKGSGRTSLLNIAATSILKNTGLFRIDLPKGMHDEENLAGLFDKILHERKPKTLDELEQALNERSTPVTIVVENLHNIFIRTVNGFELVERFLLLISRTPVKVFWIVSCGIYLWNYFEKTLSVRRYFYDVIELGDLDEEMVRDIILKRHRLSGYELEFQPDEKDKADKRYKRLGSEKERQEYLAHAFFTDLDARSQGNISVALLLWQLSVENIKPNKVVICNEMEHETGFLAMLQEDELFTLETIVEMELLTIQEHAEIFNQDEWMSEMLLLRLKNKGLLFRSGAGFQIHLLLYEQIIRVLDDKNILK
jgi:hypothetical protein